MKIDNYALSTFRTCPRKYLYRIRRGVVRMEEDRSAVEFGISIHKALQQKDIENAINAFVSEYSKTDPPMTDDKRSMENGVFILQKYFERYKRDEEVFDTIDEEIGFTIRLSPSVLYEGRIDKMIRWKDGRGYAVLDHKTTSIATRNLCQNPHNQIEGYILAARILKAIDTLCEGVFDYIYVSKDQSKYEKGEGFARIITMRTDVQMENWIEEVLQTVSLIRSCQRKKVWPKWSEGCSQYFTLCPYNLLCTAEERHEQHIIDQFYRKDIWNPFNE